MKKEILTLIFTMGLFINAPLSIAGEVSAAFFNGEAVVQGEIENLPAKSYSSFISDHETLVFHTTSDNSIDVYKQVTDFVTGSFSGFASAEFTDHTNNHSQTVYFYTGEDGELYAFLESGSIVRWEKPNQEL